MSVKDSETLLFDNKHFLDDTKSSIRFVLPGQAILGEVKLNPTSIDPSKLI